MKQAEILWQSKITTEMVTHLSDDDRLDLFSALDKAIMHVWYSFSGEDE